MHRLHRTAEYPNKMVVADLTIVTKNMDIAILIVRQRLVSVTGVNEL